jgi:hypothetical protein
MGYQDLMEIRVAQGKFFKGLCTAWLCCGTRVTLPATPERLFDRVMVQQFQPVRADSPLITSLRSVKARRRACRRR